MEYDEIGSGGCLCGGESPASVFHPANGGILTGPPASLQSDLANCTAWQTWAGADYFNRIYITGAGLNELQNLVYPAAVITVTEETLNLRIETDGFNRGDLILWFADYVPPTYSDCAASSYNFFCNNLEAVLSQLFPKNAGMQLKRSARFLQRPEKSSVNDIEDVYTAAVTIAFGVS